MEDRFQHYKQKFHEAYAKYKTYQFDQLELLYRGTKSVDKNVNDTSKKDPKKTDNVRNIVFELIETQVNTEIPEPSVVALERGFKEQAKMVQGKIKSDINILDLESLADRIERDAPMMGLAAAMMGWDLTAGTHTQAGEKELIVKHPKQVIPQPGVYDVRKMDYIFLMGASTIGEIERRYGVVLEVRGEQYPEINEITTETSAGDTNENVTEIVCFYRDDETKEIGKLTWVLDELLEDYPMYFFPRKMVCPKCKKEYDQGSEKCECGAKLKEEVQEYEIIQEDLELEPISYEKTVKKVVENELGEKRIETEIVTVIEERNIPKGTEIRFPAPREFPIAIRINTPLNFSFAGQSDTEVIRSPQQEVKKAMSKASEKIHGSGTIVEKPKSVKTKLTNATYQEVGVEPQEAGQIKVSNLQAEVSQEVEFAQTMYDQAKSTLGITDSFQGKYDPSAKSGRAKQVQVQQAAGRLQSKIKNKYTFYSRIFELMFQFDLAFSQEERAYLVTDSQGKKQYAMYDKHNLLRQDASGEWYYCIDFHFGADESAAMPNIEQFVFEQAPSYVQAGLLEKKQFWQIMSSVDFPFAKKILAQFEEQEEDTETIEILAVLKQLNPQQLQAFLQQPVEQQIAFLEQSKTPQEG